jgi:deferrochelatase/peroxidase EfeB
MPGTPIAIDYADVQGTILRGYRVDLARHFVLSISDVRKAGALIGALVDGTGGLPRITTAARWTVKPECFVNVAFTAAGLAKLGVTAQQLAATFDPSFVLGATDPQSAQALGDVGASAPANWIGGIGKWAAVHLILSLWVTTDPVVLERVTATLRAAFTGCMTELTFHDAKALPDNHIHFGYRDSISQPTVLGAPPRKQEIPDAQPAIATGEVLLGYPNETGGCYSVKPDQLSTNSSYAAFRILEQDVAGYEAFLAEYAPKAKIDVELLAAKVCGRWRNGNPLELKPDAPGDFLPPSEVNNFTYVSATPANDDTLGVKCPIGSHLRRNNPRNESVVGGTDSTQHRIVRRAIPYGPPYDPSVPDSKPVSRGLIGYFINASIQFQFEFLTSQWNLGQQFVMSAGDSNGWADGDAHLNISGQDVFLGVNDPSNSSFTLPAIGTQNNTTITGFSRLVTTRGSAYVFLPSITGLRYLVTLSAGA